MVGHADAGRRASQAMVEVNVKGWGREFAVGLRS